MKKKIVRSKARSKPRRPKAKKASVSRQGARRNSARDGAEEAIRKHFLALMPAAVKQQLAGANMDLYGGPLSKADARAEGIRGWKGFSHAAREIKSWGEDNLERVWYDQNAGIVETSEPQGFEDDGEWVEPFLEDYFEYDLRAVKRIVFGSELAQHIR